MYRGGGNNKYCIQKVSSPPLHNKQGCRHTCVKGTATRLNLHRLNLLHPFSSKGSDMVSEAESRVGVWKVGSGWGNRGTLKKDVRVGDALHSICMHIVSG